LGPGDAVPAVQNEERDPVDAVGASLLLVGTDRLRVVLGLEHLADDGGVEPDLGGELDEGRAVADRPALGEVGPQEALLGRIRETARAGEVDQPVGVEGVARLRLSPLEVQAHGGGVGGKVLLAGDGLLA